MNNPSHSSFVKFMAKVRRHTRTIAVNTVNCISLDHDYTLGILDKRSEYIVSQRVLKKNNIRFWTRYPAQPRFFYEDRMCTYDTVEEAMAD